VIDLKTLNPLFNGFTISGTLNTAALGGDSRTYNVGFELVCNSAYCDKAKQSGEKNQSLTLESDQNTIAETEKKEEVPEKEKISEEESAALEELKNDLPAGSAELLGSFSFDDEEEAEEYVEDDEGGEEEDEDDVVIQQEEAPKIEPKKPPGF
jgi:hypothetical protein